jgi:hypothetical protein
MRGAGETVLSWDRLGQTVLRVPRTVPPATHSGSRGRSGQPGRRGRGGTERSSQTGNSNHSAQI